MTSLVLANIDYLKHTSTEGNELQEGLRHAGWTLAGTGYDDIVNVRDLLDKYAPERVFVQDVRDWLAECNICFRKDVSFENVEALALSGVPTFTVIKDSWGWWPEQSRLMRQIKARAVVHYYREALVRETAPWIAPYELRRIHHSVDRDVIEPLLARRAERRRALVSGFLQPCYPLRKLAFAHAQSLGLDTLTHPGYGNRGHDTPRYLQTLTGYKVHVATSSQWGCAFRKIIESVACGMTPVTNLPKSDVLPEIDAALVRISPQITMRELKATIDDAVAHWDEDERRHFAAKALDYYDWREAGMRLSSMLTTIHVQDHAVA